MPLASLIVIKAKVFRVDVEYSHLTVRVELSTIINRREGVFVIKEHDKWEVDDACAAKMQGEDPTLQSSM